MIEPYPAPPPNAVDFTNLMFNFISLLTPIMLWWLREEIRTKLDQRRKLFEDERYRQKYGLRKDDGTTPPPPPNDDRREPH